MSLYVLEFHKSLSDDLVKLTMLLTTNTEINDLRKIICLRKSEVNVKRKQNSINVIEKFVEHGIHCLQCPYTNDGIDLLP